MVFQASKTRQFDGFVLENQGIVLNNITQPFELKISLPFLYIQSKDISKRQSFVWIALELCLKFKFWAFNSSWPSDATWWHKSRSTLIQVMASCLMVPNHYLNQCWLIINDILWHSPGGNFTRNARDIIHDMSLKITNLRLLPHLPGANELNLHPVTFTHRHQVIWRNVS